MEERQSGFGFWLMSLQFKIRDMLRPRKNVLIEVGLKPGMAVLDFGCGPGGYILPTYKAIGADGKIFALDVNPKAIEVVKNLAAKHKMKNIITIISSKPTGLSDGSVDVVLLYDVFHHLSKVNDILKELHRILKPEGILSVSDHHLEDATIVAGITAGNLFRLLKRGKMVHNFNKI